METWLAWKENGELDSPDLKPSGSSFSSVVTVDTWTFTPVGSQNPSYTYSALNIDKVPVAVQDQKSPTVHSRRNLYMLCSKTLLKDVKDANHYRVSHINAHQHSSIVLQTPQNHREISTFVSLTVDSTSKSKSGE